MNTKSAISLLGALAMMGMSEPLPRETKPFPSKPKSVIPKGCKEYFFNRSGCFSTDHMRRDEVVFKCFASNDKNAIRKYIKYVQNKPITQ